MYFGMQSNPNPLLEEVMELEIYLLISPHQILVILVQGEVIMITQMDF